MNYAVDVVCFLDSSETEADDEMSLCTSSGVTPSAPSGVAPSTSSGVTPAPSRRDLFRPQDTDADIDGECVRACSICIQYVLRARARVCVSSVVKQTTRYLSAPLAV